MSGKRKWPEHSRLFDSERKQWLQVVGAGAGIAGLVITVAWLVFPVGTAVVIKLCLLAMSCFLVVAVVATGMQKLIGKIVERAVAGGNSSISESLRKVESSVDTLARGMLSLPALCQSLAAENFSRICAFGGRWPRFVYTCRAKMPEGGTQCPNDGLPWPIQRPPWPFEKALPLHVPFDEIGTVGLLLSWYVRRDAERIDETMLRAIMCSIHAKREYPIEPPFPNREVLSGLIEKDCIVVGENHISRWLLKLMEPYLNFRFDIEERRKIERRFGRRRWLVPLHFKSVAGYEIHDPHELMPGYDPRKAVACIFCFPNPYNIHRHIVILFGCQRVGQYLLDTWLRSAEAVAVFREIEEANTKEQVFGWQIAISSPFEESEGGDYYGWRITCRMISSVGRRPYLRGKRFIPIEIRAPIREPDSLATEIRPEPHSPMVDISLCVPLQVHQSAIAEVLRNNGAPAFLLDGSLCHQESLTEGIGLHVTLYEFVHHEGSQMRQAAQDYFAKILASLRRPQPLGLNGTAPFTLRLLHVEILSGTVILYCDSLAPPDEPTVGSETTEPERIVPLPSQPLTQIRDICDHVKQEFSSIANGSEMPFPLHCTLCRFKRPLSDEEFSQLRQFAANTTGKVLRSIPVNSLALVLATEKPYGGVGGTGHISLQPPPPAPKDSDATSLGS